MPSLTTYQLIDYLKPGITFSTLPPQKQPQAGTPDSPSPAAAVAKKQRTSAAITLLKNKALQEAEHVQETYVSVNMFHTLENIGCEDAIPILCNSINSNDYNQCLFYFWAHIFVVVHNVELKECNEIF